VFEHADGTSHLKTVREEMQKFEPEWSPRYLAYPSCLECLPAVAAVAPLLFSSRW
jgi:lysylphosphatidylglycerol synthetase-like protein (DUF2156 family)